MNFLELDTADLVVAGIVGTMICIFVAITHFFVVPKYFGAAAVLFAGVGASVALVLQELYKLFMLTYSPEPVADFGFTTNVTVLPREASSIGSPLPDWYPPVWLVLVFTLSLAFICLVALVWRTIRAKA